MKMTNCNSSAYSLVIRPQLIAAWVPKYTANNNGKVSNGDWIPVVSILARKELKKRPPRIPLIMTPGKTWESPILYGDDSVLLATDSLSSGSASSDVNFMATPFMQNRWPVGSGPSLKTWPKCPPQELQEHSVRGRMSLKSVERDMAWLSTGA